MRNTDCYRVATLLLPHMPEFVSDKKCEIFMSPINHTLRGFMFESSASSREDFYFWWFFTPICRSLTYIPPSRRYTKSAVSLYLEVERKST